MSPDIEYISPVADATLNMPDCMDAEPMPPPFHFFFRHATFAVMNITMLH